MADLPNNFRARKSDKSLLSPKLEDLLPSVVHHLSPSNLKRTANNLMDEWEKSLVAPETRHKEMTHRIEQDS